MLNSNKKLNFSILSFFKLLSVLGFLFYSTHINSNQFKIYAIYFAGYQIVSQIVLLQLPILFFRYGKNINFKILYAKISVILVPFAFILLFILIFGFGEVNKYYYMFPVIILFSLGQITSELTRCIDSETKAYVLLCLPSVSFLISGILIFTNIIDSFFEIWIIEIIFFSITPFYGLIKYLSFRKFDLDLKYIYNLWKFFSANLYLNGIIWYFYFNAPIFFLENRITDFEFKQFAQALRIMTALSTISSLISLIYQKYILSLYIQKKEYYNFKNKFKSIAVKLYLLLSLVCLVFLFLGSGDLFIYLTPFLFFVLFSTIYFISNFLIAEEKTTIIPKSMIIGFLVFIFFISFMYLTSFNIQYSLFCIFFGLFITLTLRFKYTFYEK